MSKKLRPIAALAASAALIVGLAGCSSANPTDSSSASGDTLVVGSQAYYSNEIIAEIYAQALEANGFTVARQFQIGQREVYLPELEAGNVDVFPEYTGNLLQFYAPDTTARTAVDVFDQLQDALPDSLRVLDQSTATDQDTYTVTAEFSKTNNVTSLDQLAALSIPLTLGGNSELQTRPYGPEGLKSVYGVTVGFQAIEDSGGPLTIKALQDGQVQLVNVYSASPSIGTDNLVTLDDPKGLFLASNVVPLVSNKVNDAAAKVLNKVSAALTPAGLVALNVQSTVDGLSSAEIATQWLTEQGLN